jgi:hypothetical protein
LIREASLNYLEPVELQLLVQFRITILEQLVLANELVGYDKQLIFELLVRDLDNHFIYQTFNFPVIYQIYRTIFEPVSGNLSLVEEEQF